jgi:hypothetical protein
VSDEEDYKLYKQVSKVKEKGKYKTKEESSPLDLPLIQDRQWDRSQQGSP